MVDKNGAKIIQKIYKDKEELERSFDFLDDMGCTRGISRENLKVLNNISEQINTKQYKGFYGMLNDSQIELVKVINCKSCKSIGIDMNDILLLEGRYMIGASDKLEFCADMPEYYVEEQDTKSRLSNIDWEFYKEMAIEVYPLVFVLFTALYVAVLYSK